ncbi:MAG: AAA family ATPase [Anaerolineae bacterium]
MESLGAYLPTDRRLALARGETIPDRGAGAVLFADISGFTALSAALVQELGPKRGAEEIIRQLNRVFGAVIEEVDRYAGSVINFSGDAITCWLEGDDGLRATACALVMQRAMRPFAVVRTPGGAPIELAIKVSAVTGPVRRFVIGDPRYQMMKVLAGHTLFRFAVADHLVHKGEVLVEAGMVDRYGERLSVAEWREDPGRGERFAVVTALKGDVPHTPWPDTQIDDETARAWLIAPVYERLRGGQERFLAELRSAVAVFVEFSGIDYDGDDEAGAKLDAYVRWVQHRVARYDGQLLQVSIGDKGSYLYVAFGAPIAHEDDVERAVAIALELNRVPPELNYIRDVRIGLSQGQMRTGAFGGTTRRVYGVLGSDANIACRLMQRAEPGQILASERIARAVDGFDIQPAGRASLKGVAQPLSIFEVRGRRRAPAAVRDTSAPMVGREPERRVLVACLETLIDRRAGSLVLIEAEAGMGKSRLVADLMEQAGERGIRMLFGAADAIERATPYFAWRGILNRGLGLVSIADAESRRAKVSEALSKLPRFENWSPLLSDVLQLELADNETTGQMVGQVRADNLQELLLALLAAALGDNPTRPPTLLILEDAHWLDSSSWTLLRKVVETLLPLAVAIATRPLSQPVPVAYQRLAERADCRRLILDTLSQTNIESLISRRLGVSGLPEPMRDLIRDKAEGHPFFSEELAFALRDAGLLQIANGECRLAPGVGDLRALDFPTTIQGVITSRIDRLSPQPQLALKVASIIGRAFAYRILHDIHPVDADRARLPEFLSHLARLDITRLDAPEPDLAYVFKHIITQEVAYSLMLFQQRRELHRAAAEWYERTYADDLAPSYALLAHHWKQAVEEENAASIARFKAIDYLDKAGEQALRSSAYKEAIDFFEQAFALEGTMPAQADADRDLRSAGIALRDLRRRAHRYLKLGEAQRSWGRMAEYRRCFEQAAALYGYPVPNSTRKVMAGILRQVARQILHRLRSGRYVGRAPEADKASLLDVALVYQLLSEIFYFTNEGLLNLYSSLLTLNLSEQAGTSRELAEAYSVMCILTGSLGFGKQAEAYYRRALQTARDTRQDLVRAHVTMLSSLYRLETADWARAQADLPRAIETLDRLGDRRYWGDCMTMLASAAAFTGDFERANTLFVEIAGPRSGSLIHRTTAAVWQGRVAILQGQLDKAVTLLNSALELTADSSDPLTMVYAQIHAWSFLAAAYIRQGKIDLALSAAETASQIIARQKAGAAQLNLAFVHIAEAYLGAWEAGLNRPGADVRKFSDKARHLCRAMRMTRYAATVRALRCRGLYDWLAGKHSKAMKMWQDSLTRAQELNMPHEEAQARYEVGRHLPETDPMRAEHLARARELFAKMGAKYDLALVEAALNT